MATHAASDEHSNQETALKHKTSVYRGKPTTKLLIQTHLQALQKFAVPGADSVWQIEPDLYFNAPQKVVCMPVILYCNGWMKPVGKHNTSSLLWPQGINARFAVHLVIELPTSRPMV